MFQKQRLWEHAVRPGAQTFGSARVVNPTHCKPIAHLCCEVHYKSMQITDQDITKRITTLEQEIEAWAITRELWFDSGFQSFSERVDGDPGLTPVATILVSDGDLLRFIEEGIDGAGDEFHAILKQHGFWCENMDGVSLHIYPEEDGELHQPILDYVRWKWICSLLQPDIDDVYEEIYAHFARRPNDLHRLHWRDFEVLIARSLRHQGFQVELGPGSNDGGVDIRLMQRAPLGDFLTLVQVKRYAPHRKIDALAVQALHGVAEVEKAHQSLFVTTSAYQPAAKRFADRTSDRMQLATSQDIVQWCSDATDGVVHDKSKLIAPDRISRVLEGLSGQVNPCILHANVGVTMIMNAYALVLKETNHAALLVRLAQITVDDDGYGQVGRDRPIIDPANPPILNAETVWRSKRKIDANGNVSYWDGHNLWTTWNGQPLYFNLLD